ncbi:hypothetical protein D3C72_2111370 [compost metagenome]
MHEPRTGQAAVATEFGHPAQQTRAHDGAADDGNERLFGAQGGHQICAHLHDQQAHAQAEPERGVVMPLEDTAVRGDGNQRFVVGGRGGR